MKNVLTALVLFLIASVIYTSILLLLRTERTEEIDFIQGGDIHKAEMQQLIFDSIHNKTLLKNDNN